jgi:hypothetical protein
MKGNGVPVLGIPFAAIRLGRYRIVVKLFMEQFALLIKGAIW